MDNGGSNGGGSFEVELGSDAAEVTNVHEAEARNVGDVIREAEMLIKSYYKIADRGIRGEGKGDSFCNSLQNLYCTSSRILLSSTIDTSTAKKNRLEVKTERK